MIPETPPEQMKAWAISFGVFCLIVFSIVAGISCAYYVKVYLPNKKELEDRREFLLRTKLIPSDQLPIMQEDDGGD